MELRQLTYFVAIAESGSFSEASRRCYISQSAISQQIKLLEDEMGTSLFVRSPHHLSLTEGGTVLLPLAKDAIKSVELCKERMADVRGMLTGQLSVGLTYSLEPYIRNAVSRFLRLFPNVKLNVWYKTLPELMQMLRNRELDMAFGIKIEGEDDWVESYPALEYRLCAIMRDTHPLSTRGMLSFDDLKRQRIVLPEASIRDQNAVEYFISSEARSLPSCTYVNSASAILNLLRISNCVSILPEHIIKGYGNVKAIPISELSTPVSSFLYFQKGTYRKRACLAFKQLLQEG